MAKVKKNKGKDKMKKYTVTIGFYSSVSIEVYAKDEDRARELADRVSIGIDDLHDNMSPGEIEDVEEEDEEVDEDKEESADFY